jgi:tetratricopeptide (TPR) repeat protein
MARDLLTDARKSQADQHLQENRLEEARVLYAEIVQLDPSDADSWVKLSTISRRLGKPDDAEASARCAVRLRPDDSRCHFAFGAAVYSQGRMDEAVASFREATSLKPAQPHAHFLLGNIYYSRGRVNEAARSFREAIAIQPDFFEALSNLGGLLTALGRYEEAGKVLHEAVKIRPDAPEALTNLACVAERQGRFDEAVSRYRRALSARPQAVEVLARLAGLLERMGRIEEARTCVDQGLRLQAGHPVLALAAARLARRENRIKEGIAILDAVDRRLADAATLGEILVLLGQLHDASGEPARAFPLFVEGKRYLASANPSARKAADSYLEAVAAANRLLTGRLAEAVSAGHDPGADTPVFLVGFPRSGTTLLDQILDSHPALQTMEEKPAAERMREVFRNMRVDLADLDAARIAQLREAYFAEVVRHVERRPGAALIDKMPLNLVHIPLLWRVFPQARYILALRHPCDVCLSCFMQSFAVNPAMANFFTLEDTVRAYAAVMGLWQNVERTLPLRYQRVRYEDLVDDAERETRAVLDFLDVGWHDDVLDHAEHARQRTVINTPSYHQVTQPIYHHARYRWKRYEREMASVMPMLRPFIEHFGYAE